ncbi:unnamed protein product [Rotaria magnacalcarata]|uniref:Uncharacterized protein n=1 Tax=Rotaria magnacalcarata TaxID=392030 RepID=A0A816Z6P4_9BILA|nr:unnamed protein product [Rotaria magnacalcarata]CAF3833563.1 unnamed protein product [Rotaria magnacalcarata]
MRLLNYYYVASVILIFGVESSNGKILNGCRFVQNFYKNHPNIFELNKNQTSLTVRPLYALLNQSFSPSNQSLSIGIIYRFANTYLVPVPFVFQCPESEQVYVPNDCEFTMIDIRSDLSTRVSESTRTTTVPLHFQDYSSSNLFSLYGAYFKQSTIALKNCRLISNEKLIISDTFHLRIEFEQTIGMKCYEKCSHPQLYECSSSTHTCQCRLRDSSIEQIGHLCVDTEIASNCSRTPERCRRLCHIQQQLHTGLIDHYCQCPFGTRRIFSNNIYHCELPKLVECDNNLSIGNCPKHYACQENRCVQTLLSRRINESILPIPFILIGLLIGALLIIIILIIGLIKMRSVKCVKFVHQKTVLSTHSMNSSPATITRLSTVPSSSSPCSTLSSSSKSTKLSSTNKTLEKYTKIDLFE